MAVAAGVRRPASEVRPRADELLELLESACARLELAGSLRRRMAWIGDIELVAIPRFAAAPALFAGWGEPIDALDGRVRELVADGILRQRLDKNDKPRFGPKLKYLWYQDVAVDLFAVPRPARWGTIFAIRTGPADYSHQLVTHQGQSFRDYQGARRPGKLPRHMQVHEGQLFADGAPIDTYEEADFFAAIGEELLPPEQRR